MSISKLRSWGAEIEVAKVAAGCRRLLTAGEVVDGDLLVGQPVSQSAVDLRLDELRFFDS